jgi:hypothetical protein
MGEERGTSRWPVGTELGCLSGLALAAVASFPLFFGMAWTGAHCEPVPQCQNVGERAFVEGLAYVFVTSLVLGVAIRWLVVRLWGRGTVDFMPPAAARKAKLLTFAITALAISVAYEVMGGAARL